MKKILCLLLIFALLSIWVNPARAELPTANLAIIPITQIVTGNTAIVNIDITNASNFGGWGATLVFNPSVLKINSISDIDYSEEFITSTGNSAFPISPQINNPNGTVNLAFTALASGSGPSGNGRLVTITFTKVANGVSSLTLQNVLVSTAEITPQIQPSTVTDGSLTFTTLEPTPTPTPSPTPSPSIFPSPTLNPSPSDEPGVAHINLVVKFQGVADTRTEDRLVSLWLKRVSDGVVLSKTAIFMNNSGSTDGKYSNTTPVSFSDFQDGDYEIFVKGPRHLSKNFGTHHLIPGVTNTPPLEGELLTGESTGNNTIDQADYSQFISSFRCRKEPLREPAGKDCSSYGADADLNNQIDIDDFGYLSENYLKSGDVHPE